MIYTKDLKQLGLTSINDYYQSIIDDKDMSVNPKTDELLKDLSDDQLQDFIDWCDIWKDENNPFDTYAYCQQVANNMI